MTNVPTFFQPSYQDALSHLILIRLLYILGAAAVAEKIKFLPFHYFMLGVVS
jgi:hypothetical protein